MTNTIRSQNATGLTVGQVNTLLHGSGVYLANND